MNLKYFYRCLSFCPGGRRYLWYQVSSGGGRYLWSQVPSGRGVGIYGTSFWGLAISAARSLLGVKYLWSHVLFGGRGGRYCGRVGTQGVGVLPLVLTPNGSHQNRYGWQAGGTHTAGMLSF